MQCPHCLQHFYARPRLVDLGACGEDRWSIRLETCPNCADAIICMSRLLPTGKRIVTMIHPRVMSRQPLAGDVPEYLAEDYRESARLLDDSAKVSAALARRCLRNLLHQFGFQDSNLDHEIATLIASKQIPRVLAEWLDAVRTISKFDAYPAKSAAPAEIHAVEPGEPEVLLDALDGLFQFFFVLPAEMERKRGELLAKVDIAWKNAT